MDKLRQKDIDRFRKSYAINAVTGCWEWLLSVNHNGYGRFKVSGGTARAHRYSYQLHHGRIPVGMIVCHRCDNPGCVNPAHLWLGTNLDNQRDMISKGRKRTGDQRGEKNPGAILNRDQVQNIIDRIAEGGSNKEIALEFGVSHGTISLIRRDKIWKSLPRPDSPNFGRYSYLKAASKAVS